MWLLPSLDRPASLRRFFDAYRATGGSTPGAVLIDRRDFAANEAAYRALDLPRGWFIWQTAGVTQGDKLREVWGQLAPSAWFGYVADDCIPESPEWDKRLVEGLDGSNLVSCDDAWLAPRRVANCWVISGALARIVGGVVPPGIHHFFVDDIWEMLGWATGCWQVRMDVRVRHASVLNGAAPPDDTHRKAYGDGFTALNPGPDRLAGLWGADEQVFARWRHDDLPRLAAAVTALRGAQAPAAPDEPARPARLRPRIVMICSPIARAPVRQYTLALAETCVLLQGLGIRFRFSSVNGLSNLPQARNILVAQFLASDATDLMFIDDDVGWDKSDVVRLLESEHPLIAGVTRKKQDNPHRIEGWGCEFLQGAPPRFGSDDAAGAVEVARVATGFMRVQRRVFEAMIRASPGSKRRGPPELPETEQRFYYRFFHHGEDELTEDYLFCDRWRALGGRVFIDPRIRLNHVGEHAYAGAIGELIGGAGAKAG